MIRTRKSQAVRYLTLLITGAVLGVAMKPATQRVRAARASAAAAAIVHATPTPTPVRARYNGKIVFTSDRHNSSALSIWSMNPDGSSPSRLTDDKGRTEKLPLGKFTDLAERIGENLIVETAVLDGEIGPVSIR